ncbi:hypothetical protein Syun_019269 [Stephania yunnanensis]|uniref:Uncharacterized protein n=1 Tax=Stephania yunnanensis TaxID=152371 RepID=A0AAP0IVS4_9MAGN
MSVVAASEAIVGASEAIAICLRPLQPLPVQPPPLVVVVHRCIGNHRHLPSLSTAVGCAALAVVRRCSSLPWKPSPSTFALCRSWLRATPPPFSSLCHGLENHRRLTSPLPPLPVQPSLLFVAARYGFVSGYHCWYEHGENGDEEPLNFHPFDNHIDDANVGGLDRTTYYEMLHNVAGPSFNWNHVEESPNPQARQLYDMIEAIANNCGWGAKP